MGDVNNEKDMELFNSEISQSIFQNDREIRRKTWDRRPDRTLGRERPISEQIEIENSSNESENNSGSFNLSKNKKQYSLTNDTKITGDDIAVRDMLKQEKTTIEDGIVNTSKIPTVEEVITQTEDQKQHGMKEKSKKYLSRSKL